MAYLSQIGTANAPYGTLQKDILNYMLQYYTIPEADLNKVKALYARCGIEKRYSIVPDFDLNNAPTIFGNNNPNMQSRMQVYMKEAVPLCLNAIGQLKFDAQEITHLITVSCTGMSAPGLDILLMQQLNLPAHCIRTSVNFMGCYAAVHALKMANAFAQSPNAKVMVVLVETCTLHFQKDYSIENIATSMLFGDGTAACIVSYNSESKNDLQLESFYSEVHPNSLHDMTWNLSDTGFKMTLSAYVPDILAQNIEALLQRAIASNKKIKQINHWAIHPGGKKIVSEIKKALALNDNDVATSLQVLNDNGNMSSVTLMFVLKAMWPQFQSTESIFACAFGPGLTMETMLLTKI
jgi:alkylresorcinol/alkylpyrone synthase